MNKKKIILFASGSGTNFLEICKYFKFRKQISIKMLVCNNPKAKVLKKAKDNGVKILLINKESFYKTNTVLNSILRISPDLIVLAGFLWQVPLKIIESFPNKIINIHPALLPAYGGKGMYGMNVHKAVIENNEKMSGITIHFVDKNYDEGKIIFQKSISISDKDSSESLARKVLKLEHSFFPKIIEKTLINGE
ncbi:MAG: phosphoribosylglycinamide formyltransferase [Flavobacteriaceae bacterium]|nr:phosphoribosylglycinamide formyltransferase [Flavobacteriaceae bacterium]